MEDRQRNCDADSDYRSEHEESLPKRHQKIKWQAKNEENLLRISARLLEEYDLLEKAVTGDKNWFFQYDPKTKCQNLQWKRP